MTTRATYLVDQFWTRIAVLDVTPTGSFYHGTICLDATPPELKRLFEEFEENVEGQMFSLADEIEERIEAACLRVLFDNGSEACVTDLQVYPSTNAVSFKMRQPLACRMNGAFGTQQNALASSEDSTHPTEEGQSTT